MVDPAGGVLLGIVSPTGKFCFQFCCTFKGQPIAATTSILKQIASSPPKVAQILRILGLSSSSFF
jgi:hypothetical protein